MNHPAAQHDKLQCARKREAVIIIILQTSVLFILLHLVELTYSDNFLKFLLEGISPFVGH